MFIGIYNESTAQNITTPQKTVAVINVKTGDLALLPETIASPFLETYTLTKESFSPEADTI